MSTKTIVRVHRGEIVREVNTVRLTYGNHGNITETAIPTIKAYIDR